MLPLKMIPNLIEATTKKNEGESNNPHTYIQTKMGVASKSFYYYTNPHTYVTHIQKGTSTNSYKCQTHARMCVEKRQNMYTAPVRLTHCTYVHVQIQIKSMNVIKTIVDVVS